MEMTNGDIVLSFKRSGRKKTQIGILADLNECSKKEIEEILIAAGEDIRGGKRMATQQKEVPDTVIDLLMKRIEELDEIISSAEKEYREIASFLGIGGKR